MAGAEERRVYARALFRAGAKMRACALQDRELRAGAMLRLAGFSAGRSVCARGGCSAGQSESIAAFCVRIMTGARFYRNVLRSDHAYRAFLSECLAFGSRLLFAAERQTGRLARRCVPIPPWVEIAIRAFSRHSSVICLCGFTSGLAVYLWRSRRVTGTRGTRNEAGGKVLVGLYAIASAL